MLTEEERRCAIRAGLGQLPVPQRLRIVRMAKHLIKVVKARNPRMPFSLDAALEVIAMAGHFLNCRDLTPVDHEKGRD